MSLYIDTRRVFLDLSRDRSRWEVGLRLGDELTVVLEVDHNGCGDEITPVVHIDGTRKKLVTNAERNTLIEQIECNHWCDDCVEEDPDVTPPCKGLLEDIDRIAGYDALYVYERLDEEQFNGAKSMMQEAVERLRAHWTAVKCIVDPNVNF